ncbi:MAG: ATP-binding cassette domain-containing protein [Gammaproteobacteria bacterium]|nr:ATP-binding cassette domain-containing protein [Gammaproteobacteria bacterium]
MSTALLQLEGVSRTFDDGDDGEAAIEALADVTLEVDAGEFVCVIGPSGSGKSTLLHILGCLDQPTSGAYRVAGEDVTALGADDLARRRRETFGFVFQNYNLLESSTARDNVEMPATYTGEPRRQRRRRAAEILRAIGLGDRVDHRPAELSGGEQQRVTIGRALMNGAQVILADEPTGAVDTAQRDKILGLLERLADRGHAIIVVSHDAAVAARARRRIELADGRVVSDDGTGKASEGTVAGRVGQPGAMPWLAAVRGGWTWMRSHRLAAALTVASDAVGVWSVVALLGLAEGAHRDAAGILERMGANRLNVGGYEFSGQRFVLFPQTLADAHAIAEQVANVQSVVPVLNRRSAVNAGSQGIDDVMVRAVIHTEPRTTDNVLWPLEQGTFPTEGDNDSLAQVAVIGRPIRDRLIGTDANALGTTIFLDGTPFEVKGVLGPHPGREGEGVAFATTESGLVWQETVVFIPFRTGAEVLYGTDQLNFIQVFVDDVSRIDETAADVRDLMNRRHDREGYTLTNRAEQLAAHMELSNLHATILGALAGVSLLAGGLAVMGVTLAAVSQRTREIGIRMAVGARRRDITLQFLAETAVPTTLGGGAGTLLGLATTPFLVWLADAPVALAPWFVPVALACGIATGLVFGIVPARRASRLDPVAALATT